MRSSSSGIDPATVTPAVSGSVAKIRIDRSFSVVESNASSADADEPASSSKIKQQSRLRVGAI